MSNILNILDHIGNTPSRNNKLSILKNISSLDEDLFLDVVRYALDPQYNYYIKEHKMPQTYSGKLSLYDAFYVLEQLNAREITGNEALNKLEWTLLMLSQDDAEVLRRIIKRDLRCGISAKTINKVWPDHIYIHPYMRASSFNQKNLANLEYPCISQTKMDGLYCDIIVMNDKTMDKVTLMTRNGSILDFDISQIESDLVNHVDNVVLQGELLAIDEDGEIMSRSLSNGYLNSDNIEAARVKFYAWDIIPIDDFNKKKCSTPYRDRFETLIEHVNVLGDWITYVDTWFCETPEQVLEHFKDNRAKNEEGTIVKNYDMIWKDGTSKDQIKIKVEFTCDLKIVGYKEGKGKFEGLVGSVECETSDGHLSVSVSGFSDDTRKQLTKDIDDLIASGAIMEVKSNDVITNQKDPEKYSLFLPRFVELRKDKTQADSLERVNEQLQAYTNMLKL